MNVAKKTQRTTERLPVPLTDAEVQSFGQDLAAVRLDIAKELSALKDHTKAVKNRVDEMENRSDRLAHMLRTRSEDREVEVYVTLHQERGVVEYVRADTSEVVRLRAATLQELQMEIPQADGEGEDLTPPAETESREPGSDDATEGDVESTPKTRGRK